MSLKCKETFTVLLTVKKTSRRTRLNCSVRTMRYLRHKPLLKRFTKCRLLWSGTMDKNLTGSNSKATVTGKYLSEFFMRYLSYVEVNFKLTAQLT